MTTSSPAMTSTSNIAHVIRIAPPAGMLERAIAVFLRGFLRVAFRTVIGPPFGPRVQRAWINALAFSMPARRGVRLSSNNDTAVPVEISTPTSGPEPESESEPGVILYVHGGAFCLGSPKTHRSVTSHLAFESGMPVWTPDYRLAPEHPYPAALDDVATLYRHLISSGYRASEIVLAGDSAGATLALALALRLREQQLDMPACIVLISPVTDPQLNGASMHSCHRIDPMIRSGWLQQGLRWYGCPAGTATHAPLQTSLHGLPPVLIQVGDQELLLSDSTRLAGHAVQDGVNCSIEIYSERWHVFHLQSFYLRSARLAIKSMAAFAQQHLNNKEI